jgi:hypothetical protein
MSMLDRFANGWTGIHAETIDIVHRVSFEYRASSPSHMLILTERGSRYDGETMIDGAAKSTLRDFSPRLSFVPAGHQYRGWQKPRVLTRVTYLHIDPAGPLLDALNNGVRLRSRAKWPARRTKRRLRRGLCTALSFSSCTDSNTAGGEYRPSAAVCCQTLWLSRPPYSYASNAQRARKAMMARMMNLRKSMARKIERNPSGGEAR